MKINGLLLFTICLLLAQLSWGDTVKLKDGTTLEGTVLTDTPEKVVISVEIRPGIREERTFKGEDVALVTKSTKDEKQFKALKELVPTPDRLKLADYRSRINKLKAFLNAFPRSKHRRDANGILETLEEEAKKVEAGGIKLGGKWLTKEELESNAYEIDAQILAGDMMQNITDGSLLAALRKFEELKQNYPGSRAFSQAIPAAKEALEQYQAVVKKELAQVDARIETREKELMTLGSNAQKASREEIARIATNYAKRLEYEKKTKTKWLTLESYHKGPMEETLRLIDSELKKIGSFDASKLKPISELYRTAWAAASARNRTRVEELANELKSARIQPKYLKLLEQRLITREAEAKAAGEPDFVDPEEAAKEKEEKAEEEKKEEEEQPEEPSTDSAEDDRADEEADEESGGLLRPILFGIIGIVIIVALVVALTGKKKG